jgi:midasin (ATPase involved in ribosome maturation)
MGHLLHTILTDYYFDLLFQNLSQQSDIADLLGGFKPMDAQFICFPLYKEFEDLFSKTFSMKVFFFSKVPYACLSCVLQSLELTCAIVC